MTSEYCAEYIANGHRVEVRYHNTPKGGQMKIWIDRALVSDEDGVAWRDAYETEAGLIEEAKSTIEMMADAAVRELEGFGAACFDDNTIEQLRSCHEPDRGDCETWGLTEDEWRREVRAALHAMLLCSATGA